MDDIVTEEDINRLNEYAAGILDEVATAAEFTLSVLPGASAEEVIRWIRSSAELLRDWPEV